MIFNYKDGIRTMDTIERYFDIVVTKVISDTSILINMNFLSEECYKCPVRYVLVLTHWMV